MRVLPMGPGAVLLDELPDGAAEWAADLRRLAADDVVDVVPAARTVLVSCRDADALARVLGRLAAVAPRSGARHTDQVVTIPVRYDGEDLASVAAAAGLTVPELIDVHSASLYQVSFCGFAPGFAYLTGLDHRLHLPRRERPRERVPAGSLAIAAEYSAVYPRQSPGGWHLLGTTEAIMFDPDRDPPVLLAPGDRVRFESR